MPTVKVNGITINYKMEGEGEPLVMIMGFSANQGGWVFQVPFFKKHYRVITFDNRGIGKSDKPEGPYSTQMMAEDTIGLMDHLHIEKAHIMGVSMGGMIAQKLALNHPSRVLKLILACTYANKLGASGDTQEMAKAAKLTGPKMSVAMVRLALNRPFYRMISVLTMRISAAFRSASDKTGLKGQAEACNKHNSLGKLPLIKAPTLVIVGTKDRIIKPSSSEVIASKISNAKLVRVEGGSHAFNMEMSKVFNKEALKFLQE